MVHGKGEYTIGVFPTDFIFFLISHLNLVYSVYSPPYLYTFFQPILSTL